MQVKDLTERLGQLRALRLEVDKLSQRIKKLELEARGGARQFTGMPRGRSMEDRMARCAVEIADLRERMTVRRMDCIEELGRLYAFIDDAPDSMLRQVLAARYIDGMSWQRVAVAMGEIDEQVPRRLHNRYLKQRVDEWNKNNEVHEQDVV